MQSNAQKLWIKNPSAATIATQTIDGVDQVTIDGQITIVDAPVTACVKECATPCTEEQWTIVFENVDFGTCNDCAKSVGFFVVLRRNSDFDTETYLQYNGRKLFSYQGTKAGSITAPTLATYFRDEIQALQNQNDQHDLFYLEAELATTTVTNDTLVITLPCTGLVSYTFEAIGQLENNNLLSTELPTITKTVDGVEAELSKEKLLQAIPMGAGHVFGEAPKDFFTWCESVCLIQLKGCYDPCQTFAENQNTGYLSTGAIPFDLLLYVNSDAPGFGDFITDINAAFANCSLDGVVGVEGVGVAVDASVTDIPLADLVFDATAGTPYLFSNGVYEIYVPDATSGADLATKLQTLWPTASTFIHVPGPPEEITVANEIVTNNGGYFKIQQVMVPSIYGE